MANYAGWWDELKPLHSTGLIDQTWISPLIHTESYDRKELDRRYAKLSTPALQAWLRVRCIKAGVEFLRASVVAVENEENQPARVMLNDGRSISSAIFIDAAGSNSGLSLQKSAHPGWQTAYGMLIEIEDSQGRWDNGEMSLMDYRNPWRESGQLDHHQFACFFNRDVRMASSKLGTMETVQLQTA